MAAPTLPERQLSVSPRVGADGGARRGPERWIVYPIVLWLVTFGSYLLANADLTDARNPAGTGG